MTDRGRLVHMVVYFCGRCTSCKTYNEQQIYDYGRQRQRELEAAMDEVNHQIHPIPCKKCAAEYLPEYLEYRDIINTAVIIRHDIPHGNFDPPEVMAERQAAHALRYELFAAEGEAFWAAYISFALEDWRNSVNELLRWEIAGAYGKMGLPTDQLRTDQQARRDVLNRIKSDEDKVRFWRLANKDFIEDELLSVGAMGWETELTAKRCGLRRTQFGIMHLPIDPVLEPLRTNAIGKLFKHDRGDNSFLLRRISAQAQELEAARERTTKYYRQVEEARAETAEAHIKLANAYETIRELRESKAPIVESNLEDRRRIRELKSFIGELMSELRELRKQVPRENEETVPAVEIEENHVIDTSVPLDVSALVGKTIAIIGGRRNVVQDYPYPCEIVTHTGDGVDHAFLATLRVSDYIVVLTRFVSHAAMWEAKAHAIDNDVPIIFCSEINIYRILDAIIRSGGGVSNRHL